MTPWYEALLEPFQASIANPRTATGYTRRARTFFAWLDVKKLSDISTTALFAYFKAHPEEVMTDNEKNILVSAMRAFVGWANGASVPCPAFEFPDTVKIKKMKKPKRAKVALEPDEQEEGPTDVENEAEVPAQALATVEAAPAPEPIPAPVRHINPSVTLGVAPRTTQKRGLRVDPLEALCPAQGSIRVLTSDGAGGYVQIGQFQEQAFQGCADMNDFVERNLRKDFGPKPGGPNVTFRFFRRNRAGDAEGQGTDITLAAPAGAGYGGGHDNVSVSSLRVEMAAGLAKIQETILREQAEKMNSTANMMEKQGKHDAADMIRELSPVLKPDMRASEALVERVVGKYEALQASTPPPPTQETTLVREVMQRNTELMDRLLPKPGEPAAGLAGMGAMKEIAEVVAMMKGIFAPPVAAQTSPSAEVAELRQELRDLRMMNERAAMARPVSEEDDLDRTAKKFLKLKEVAGEFFGGGDGAGASEGLGQHIPAFLNVLNNAVNKFVPAFTFAKKGGAAPEEQPSEQKALPPKKKTTLPADAQLALTSLRDLEMEIDDDADEPTEPQIEAYESTTASALFSLIMALKNDPDWATTGDMILARFKEATIRAQIHALVVDTFMTCGQQKMLSEDPDLADRVAEVIAEKYPEIHEQIPGWGAKSLIDQVQDDEDDEEPVIAPATTAATVSDSLDARRAARDAARVAKEVDVVPEEPIPVEAAPEPVPVEHAKVTKKPRAKKSRASLPERPE